MTKTFTLPELQSILATEHWHLEQSLSFAEDEDCGDEGFLECTSILTSTLRADPDAKIRYTEQVLFHPDKPKEIISYLGEQADGGQWEFCDLRVLDDEGQEMQPDDIGYTCLPTRFSDTDYAVLRTIDRTGLIGQTLSITPHATDA